MVADQEPQWSRAGSWQVLAALVLTKSQNNSLIQCTSAEMH